MCTALRHRGLRSSRQCDRQQLRQRNAYGRTCLTCDIDECHRLAEHPEWHALRCECTAARCACDAAATTNCASCLCMRTLLNLRMRTFQQGPLAARQVSQQASWFKLGVRLAHRWHGTHAYRLALELQQRKGRIAHVIVTSSMFSFHARTQKNSSRGMICMSSRFRSCITNGRQRCAKQHFLEVLSKMFASCCAGARAALRRAALCVYPSCRLSAAQRRLKDQEICAWSCGFSASCTAGLCSRPPRRLLALQT